MADSPSVFVYNAYLATSSYRFNPFSVLHQRPLVLNVIRSHPRLDLVSQSLQKDRIGQKVETGPLLRHAGLSTLHENTCNFFISFLRSASYFSFWLAFAALWTCTGRREERALERTIRGERREAPNRPFARYLQTARRLLQLSWDICLSLLWWESQCQGRAQLGEDLGRVWGSIATL